MIARPSSERRFTAKGLLAARDYLQSQGIDWSVVANAVGFDPEMVISPGTTLPFSQILAASELVADLTGNDASGVVVGSVEPVGAGGIFDYIALTSPTVRKGLQNWVRFHDLPTNAFSLHYEEDDAFGYLRWEVADSYGPRAQFMGMILSFIVSRIKLMLEGMDVDLAIEFSHLTPTQIDTFERVLGRNIRYEQPHDRIGVPADVLPIRPASGEPVLYQVVEQAALQELNQRESEDNTDQFSKLTGLISEAIRNGDLSLDSIAREMAMSPRTLQRLLESSNTSFRQLTDDIRKAIAHRYLCETDVPMHEIAFLAGYSEPSVFSRKAKGWFGVPPHEYRMRSHDGF